MRSAPFGAHFNIITPIMAYFPLIVVFAVVWYLLGIPFGLGN
jgi:p-aminobenzoyl-glutamate transporter AbgT